VAERDVPPRRDVLSCHDVHGTEHNAPLRNLRTNYAWIVTGLFHEWPAHGNSLRAYTSQKRFRRKQLHRLPHAENRYDDS